MPGKSPDEVTGLQFWVRGGVGMATDTGTRTSQSSAAGPSSLQRP